MFQVSDYEKVALFSAAIRTSLNVDIVLHVSIDSPKTIELERIVVPSAHRNKGIGTKVMCELVSFAKAEGYGIELVPAGIGDNDNVATCVRLRDFYSRFGFVDSGMGSMRLEARSRKL